MSKDQTQQFATLYRALATFDDQVVQDRLTCPRLCAAHDDLSYDAAQVSG